MYFHALSIDIPIFGTKYAEWNFVNEVAFFPFLSPHHFPAIITLAISTNFHTELPPGTQGNS